MASLPQSTVPRRTATAPSAHADERGRWSVAGIVDDHSHRHLRRGGARPAASRGPAFRTSRSRPVVNDFFGGNIGVTGLLTFADVDAALREVPDDRRVLLPDVCLSGGRFLDGGEPAALVRDVEVVASDGAALRRALSRRQVPVAAGFG